MTLGIDLGSGCFRAIKRSRGRLVGRRIPADYVVIPDMASRRQLLQQAQIQFLAAEGSLIVVGDEAQRLAEALQLPLLPLFPDSQLPEDDPVARQIVARCVESLAPCVPGDHAKCTLALPSGAGSNESAEFLQRVFRLLNYAPHVIPAAHAVGLAELGRDGLSGLALNFGAGSPSICLLHRGRLEAAAATKFGGAWIDRQFAEQRKRFLWDGEGGRYLDLAAVRRWKASTLRFLRRPADDDESALSELYRQAIDELCLEFAAVCSRRQFPLPNRPQAIACHGGGAQIGDFADMLRERWQAAGVPIPLSGVRIIPGEEWVVARGCLIHAEVEAAGQPRQSA
jgi:hypothetical protein